MTIHTLLILFDAAQIPWKDDDQLLAAWRDGRTGHPWIDAAMVQVLFHFATGILFHATLNLPIIN
jgi:deoxyribodipyrimidine photolyase